MVRGRTKKHDVGRRLDGSSLARCCLVLAPGDEAGFGVSWRARDAGGGRRIKELVRRMERLTEERFVQTALMGT